MTTEQMVRKCFCPTPNKPCATCQAFAHCHIWKSHRKIASRCRRFVRMENKQRHDILMKRIGELNRRREKNRLRSERIKGAK